MLNFFNKLYFVFYDAKNYYLILYFCILFKFEKAALRKNVDAMFMCAKMHDEGSFGTKIDEKKALLYYKKAADEGHAESMFRIAQILEKCDVETDKMEANLYLKRAADLGHQGAKSMLKSKIDNYESKHKIAVKNNSNEEISKVNSTKMQTKLGSSNVNKTSSKPNNVNKRTKLCSPVNQEKISIATN